MEMKINLFKQNIKKGIVQWGIWNSMPGPAIAEILADVGFDWVLIDMEHSPQDQHTVLTSLQAMAPFPSHPIVRVVINDTAKIKQVLDLGAQSILVPYVESADEARKAVNAVRYPPAGIRGVAGLVRAGGYGRIKDYHKKADKEICLLVQVETKKALDSLEEIAAVEGVDGIFFGPADLSASMGLLGQPSNETVVSAIENAIRKLKKMNMPSGVLTFDRAALKRYIASGCLFNAVGVDLALLSNGADSLLAEFKK